MGGCQGDRGMGMGPRIRVDNGKGAGTMGGGMGPHIRVDNGGA